MLPQNNQINLDNVTLEESQNLFTIVGGIEAKDYKHSDEIWKMNPKTEAELAESIAIYISQLDSFDGINLAINSYVNKFAGTTQKYWVLYIKCGMIGGLLDRMKKYVKKN